MITMQELEFSKEIGDMDGAQARATLQDVRSKYNEARSEYEQAQEEVTEYRESLEAAEEEAEAAREFFAEFAAEESGLSQETILDKFSDAAEIRSEFLSDADFQIATGETETEETEEEENKFSEKEEKSDNLPGDGQTSEYTDRAKGVIGSLVVNHE